MVLLLRKLYLYCTNDSDSRGWGQTFSRGGGGVQTHVRTCYFPGGGVSGPPIPLWIRTWAMSS